MIFQPGLLFSNLLVKFYQLRLSYRTSLITHLYLGLKRLLYSPTKMVSLVIVPAVISVKL